ncbi:potassium transporter [Corchorus olitorius]|uniref:Potassium transporter n=1 Tax=Corchorus olitorius TaxID=93759 RepID=A0A1R3JC08_9ROSI|nr:potassium transporter [Corchorus olitorius]
MEMTSTSRVEIDEDSDNNKGSMWDLDQKLDQPMDEEAGRLRNMYKEKKSSALLLLRLAFQSLGVVYGDLGTSPLYVFYNTFPGKIEDPEDVIGALSLIIYSLTLIPLLKYVFVVCKANDNGQGGTFALYSLLCRHAKINTIPNQHRTDEELTTYSRSTFHEQSFAAKTKRWLERYVSRKNALLILVLVGLEKGIKLPDPVFVSFFWSAIFNSDKCLETSKVDMSKLLMENFLSAAGGIKVDHPHMSNSTEALFADLAHFPVAAVQLAFTVVVFPCLLLAYCGQASYLVNNRDHVVDAFYRSIPDSIYWPVFVIATAAAIVASQATISATFSIIKQALALGCFPRVKVVHTSKKFLGQIYVPDINWILMVLCIAVTAGFKNQSQIGNAYGTAVVIVMLVTTLLMTLIMILVWRCHWILVVLFTGLSLVVECTYFSAVLFKVDQGGWVPLVIAAAFLLIMYVWHYGTVKRYEFEMHSKVSMAWILGLGPSLGLVRVPGIGLVYTELASGVPHIFSHFITNLPAIHSVVVFVCVKYLPVYTVPEEERFLVKRIGPKNFHMFRCVARYGYKDLHKKDDDFEKKLFDSLFLFVRLESMMEGCSDSDEYSLYGQQTERSRDFLLNNNGNTASTIMDTTISSVDSIVPVKSPMHANFTVISSGQASSQTETDELEFLNSCRDAGVVHIMGNTVTLQVSSFRLSAMVSLALGAMLGPSL